jgi:hypothetical protein
VANKGSKTDAGARAAPPAAARAEDAADAEVDVRGQGEITLGGETYRLRPSWEAIEEIERQTRPLYVLASIATTGGLTLVEIGVILTEMLKAQGRTMDEGERLRTTYLNGKRENWSRLAYEESAPKVCAILGGVLLAAVRGGYTAEGEAKAAATTGETQGAA